MSIPLFLLAAAAQPDPEIVVSAAREAVEASEAPASSTIFDDELLRILTLPNAADLLRLSPGIDVATTGPRGTQTQLRVRGAEANHTLLFVDGIRFNDPAAGNEPRFELLTTDLASRIELVRGPQSALWGAEALGGVIAVQSVDPFVRPGLLADTEYGSFDSGRLFGRYAFAEGHVGLAATAGWQRSDGIDSFGGGERDGFDTLSASLRAVYRGGDVEAGAVGHWIEGTSEYDGFDPVTFLRSNTLDETDNRIAAARGWITGEWDSWRLTGEVSYLDSANRNTLAGAPLNRTFGDRATLGAQLSRRIGGHLLIGAVEHQAEDFRARDDNFGGGTDQDRSRNLTALVGEWRAEWGNAFATDVAVRHDNFSAFENATTIRASALVRPGGGWRLHAAYGEGIAQPTFYDLFGFFPGSFVGNPNLTPERSRGFEAGLRWANTRASVGITAFSSRLSDEIVDVFDPITFQSSTANASGRSRRKGVELAASWRHADWLNLAFNYTWLDSGQQTVAGSALVREVRRARHSANLVGYGGTGRLRWSASLAYVGRRRDTDFDVFPARTVTLDDYLLASLRIGWRILPQFELYGRMENGFDADYQDVVGYNTPGRTVHAGLRFLLGR